MRLFRILVFAAVLGLSLQPSIGNPATIQDESIQTQTYFSHDSIKVGNAVDGAILLDIPAGYHINSNKPTDKFAIPTSIKLSAPEGVLISPVQFPKAKRMSFSFSKVPLLVFEGKPVMRFTVVLPLCFEEKTLKLTATVRYQACNDEMCFPPETRNIEMEIPVALNDRKPSRINDSIFVASMPGPRKVINGKGHEL